MLTKVNQSITLILVRSGDSLKGKLVFPIYGSVLLKFDKGRAVPMQFLGLKLIV